MEKQEAGRTGLSENRKLSCVLTFLYQAAFSFGSGAMNNPSFQNLAFILSQKFTRLEWFLTSSLSGLSRAG
jgi:hypothetical protein